MRHKQDELTIRPYPPPPQRGKARRVTRGRVLILGLMCALIGGMSAAKDKPPVQYKIPTPALTDFTPVEWLQGRWTGRTVSSTLPGEVKLTVNSDLGSRFLVFRGEVSLPATKTVPASQESWMGILSASSEGPGFTLRVFSSTGFITRYRLMVEGAEIHLNPEGGDPAPPGWLFRKVWARTATDEFTETVQAAPLGKAFFDYYTAKFTRVPAPAKTPSAP